MSVGISADTSPLVLEIEYLSSDVFARTDKDSWNWVKRIQRTHQRRGERQGNTTTPLVRYKSPASSSESIERVEETFRGIGVIGKARETIQAASNSIVRQYANSTLLEISNALKDIDTTEMPQIWAGEGNDGAILLEWMFPGARIGFAVEPEILESGWYIVIDEKPELINEYGLLFETRIRDLLLGFLQRIGQI